MKYSLAVLAKRSKLVFAWITLLTFLSSSALPALAINASQGGALPQPLPLFPADNWWNLDVSSWPVDLNSAGYISFINNGGTRRLHPDFGGDAGGNSIYGIPYAVITNVTDVDLKAVEFLYSDESDGVNQTTNSSFPFYPIPPAAITGAHWIEGGNPGNIDERSFSDRHLLIVDRDRNYLYELYNVFYDSAQAKWLAGSGAFFDMNTNNRRPDTWTSADAAGLAILPGLVRYDEFSDPTMTEIKHAFRVTVRATNGYVFPASHRAGSTAGALPMGARLRLKSSVDVTQKTSNPNIQKIFRAMQKYGLIVADNGTDMYITGTYDTRWDNGILNPAFSNLTASDFEVVQLGYNPTASAPALSSVTINPATVTGGQATNGTVSLTNVAPAGGVSIGLTNANPAATVANSVTVPGGMTSANFAVTTVAVSSITVGNITATYNGTSKTASLAVNPVALPVTTLSALTLNPASVRGGFASIATVTLSGPAPTGGFDVSILSGNLSKATVPSTVKIPAGSLSINFTVNTAAVSKKTVVTITASAGAIKKSATLTLNRR